MIKHLRLLCGLSQAELGTRASLHQTTVGKLESGVLTLTKATEQKLLFVFAVEGIGGQEIALLHSVFESRKMKPVKKGREAI